MDVYVCVCVCILLSPSFRSLLVNHCLVAVEVDVPRFKLHISISIQILLRSLQLLEHLQLQIHLHLNKKMVEQVRVFAGCPRDFYTSLVMKLQLFIQVRNVRVNYCTVRCLYVL